jgi:hypothetical protein
VTEPRPPLNRTFGSFALAVLAVALAAFASCRAREGTFDGGFDPDDWAAAVSRLDRLPQLPSPVAGLPFWIGGWVGPPVDAVDPATWRTFREAGLDISMGPLEDRFSRPANLARLAAVDSLEASLFTFVRDDSVHPDETTRPGWEQRVEAIVGAYRGHRSLAGYFLADEPSPADRGLWSPAARLLRRLDPAHPAYVNFVGLLPREATDRAAREHWRDQIAASVRDGDLPLFTFDAYPFLENGTERATYLATLREAARVSHETQRPFGAVLQFTGHGDLRAVTAEEASYQAMEALAHGASCVIWFTYWTPNPDDGPWRWHDGAITYDGTRTLRHDLLSEVNGRVRGLAGHRGAGPMLVVHVGGGLPAGLEDDPLTVVPDVDSLSGAPLSIGFGGTGVSGTRTYFVVNRDTRVQRSIRLRMSSAVDSLRFVANLPGGDAPFLEHVERGPGPAVTLTLEPGAGAVVTAWRRPRSSSRSDTR